MPLYEYTCNKCNSRFELLVGVGNKKTFLECPQCESKSLRKEFSVFGMKISDESGSSATASSCSSCTASGCEGCLS